MGYCDPWSSRVNRDIAPPPPNLQIQSQVFPLSGASVYEHVSASGEVTFARDPGVL